MKPVLVCRGCDDSRPLLRALVAEGVPVRTVGCQKICKGPVAGCRVDGCLEWFSRLDKPKQRKALITLASGGSKKASGDLERRRVRKRAGRKPR